jgi:hypothetical protein
VDHFAKSICFVEDSCNCYTKFGWKKVLFGYLMNNLTSEKLIEVRKLIDVAYLVLVLAAFAWAKEFLLPLILPILISCLLAPVVSRLELRRFHIATLGNPRVTPSCSS